MRPCSRSVNTWFSARAPTELELATFAACGFTFGLRFDEAENPPFRDILLDPALDADGKTARLALLLDELRTIS